MAGKKGRTSRPTAARVYQTIPVEDLTGGLDLRRSPTLLASHRARVLRNWSLEEPGALVVRPGYQAFTTNSLGGASVQGGARIYLASTIVTLLAWEGGVYTVADAGGAQSTTAVLTGLSTANRLYFTHDRDLVAVFDGSTTVPQKSTNGTAWTLFGIRPSTLGSTLASASSGSLLANEFEVSFAYKDRGLAHYGNVSTRNSTITLGATGAITVQVPNSTDAQVDAIAIYARNKTAGETVLRKVSSAAQSTGTGSTYTITSSAWTSNDEAPTDHDVAPGLAFGRVWKNRWWARDVAAPNRLRFSQIFQPQSWPALFYIDIPFERGDTITALEPLGDTLVVFGQSKVYLIIGQTSLDFEVRPSGGALAGALGPKATTVIEQGVLHAAAEGVFMFDGAADRYLSHDLSGENVGWDDLISRAPSSAVGEIALSYHFPRKEVRIAVPRLYPYATRGEWILDLDRTRTAKESAWTQTDRDVGGYISWDGPETVTGQRGRLFTWPSTGGQLFEESTGTSANSSNLVAEYEGPTFALGLHRARIVDLHGEYEPHAGTLSAEAITDQVSQGTIPLSIGAGLAIYGTSVYGTATYGGIGRRKFHTFLPLGAEGRSVTLKLTYTGTERYKQFTYALGVIPESSPRQFGE